MQRHQTIALVLAIAAVTGCRTEPPPEPHSAVVQDDSAVQGTVVGDHRTAMEAAIDSGTGATTSAPPAAGRHEGLQLAPNAPDSYTVKRGDTLWGIAKVFLKDPWYWPEIWQVNPQVQNPHLIYPGDTLHLVYVDGRPRIVLQPGSLERGNGARVMPRVRSQPLEAAVTTIPYETVAAFMSKPSVLEEKQIKTAPYVLSTRDSHVVMSEGNTVYARGFKRSGRARRALQPGARRRAAARPGRQPHPGLQRRVHGHRPRHPRRRPGDAHHDRVDARDLPRRQAPAGRRRRAARLHAEPAEDERQGAHHGGIGWRDASSVSTKSWSSIAAFATACCRATCSRCISASEPVYDNSKHGFVHAPSLFAKKVDLPDERTGTFMVFKTFDRMSFGLIMEATDVIRVADKVQSP